MNTKMMLITGMVAIGLAGCGAPHRGVNANQLPIGQRNHVQRSNINEGVRSGDLTRREANRLRDQSRNIQQARRDARNDDGYIDGRERRKIKKQQRKLGNQIYNERRDGQTR